ncbi:MAG: ABC transporter permease [Deltaproteobacteria bacterium]|nr:ABC transporter permease [Deltaproteobacteria bacterium]
MGAGFIVWLKDIWRRVPKGAVIIILLLIATAVFADFMALHDPEIGDPRQRLLPPVWGAGGQWSYLLGTDTMGRDVLSRLIYGSRISLLVAFSAVIIAGCIGTVLGVIAGFFGGWVDQVIMRFTDAWLSIPTVMFGVLMAVILGPGVWNIVIILGGTFWSRYARVVRGQTLSIKSRDFVQLARIAGCGKFWIIRKHILPNVFDSVITLSSLQIGIVIVVEASLTFLGVGVPPPKPAWGLMLSEGRGGLLAGYWWLVIFPGVAIALLVTSFNVIGDWLRRYLDPFYRNIE